MTVAQYRRPWVRHERLAGALEGDLDALRRIARATCKQDSLPSDSVLWPALDLAARYQSSQGREVVRPTTWRRALLTSSARWISYEQAVDQLSLEFSKEEIDWLPIKGFDVGTYYYPQPEARWLSDVDILVHPSDLSRAKHVLQTSGWHPLYDGPAADDYLRNEGYCWPVVSPDGVLVEIHIRFWGLVPSGFEAMVLAQGLPDATRDRNHPHPTSAWLIAAVHSWLDPAPRSLSGFCDLELIARDQDDSDAFVESLSSVALDWDLQLPCALAASACWRLFKNPVHRRLLDRLTTFLSRPESQVLDRLNQRGVDGVSLGSIVRARLVSRRRSRAGLRSVLRHLWAHRAIVERETDSQRAFWLRRVIHLTRHWRRRPVAPLAPKQDSPTPLERTAL